MYSKMLVSSKHIYSLRDIKFYIQVFMEKPRAKIKFIIGLLFFILL